MTQGKLTRREALASVLAAAAVPFLPAATPDSDSPKAGCYVICRMNGQQTDTEPFATHLQALVESLPDEMPVEIDFIDLKPSGATAGRGVQMQVKIEWAFA